MPNRAAPISKALTEVANAIKALPGEQEISQIVGWTAPPLNKHEISRMASRLSDDIAAIPDTRLNQKYDYDGLAAKILALRTTPVPNLFNNNGTASYDAIRRVLEWVRDEFSGALRPIIPEVPTWEQADEKNLLPTNLAKRLRAVRAQVKALEQGSDTLDQKLSTIDSAYNAALSLPTDLESLEDARNRISENLKTSEMDFLRAGQAASGAEEKMEAMRAHEKEIAEIVANVEDAYSAATTKGLGEAFQRRADRTAATMWVWVGGLIIALLASAALGIDRVRIVEDLIKQKAPPVLTELHTALAFLSIAAPVWFAWIATKQIGQRFRLSEDYAYKASVAQAYEGYRRVASRVDEAFAKRLFSTALDRLEEPPLRYVEHETHGSPLHEWWKLRIAAARGAREGAAAAQTGQAAASPTTSEPKAAEESG